MFQNFSADVIQKLNPFVAATSVVNAAPHLRLIAASTPLEQRLVGRTQFTPAVNDYSSFAVGCADPDQRGPMVLSYSMCAQYTGGNPSIGSPWLIDRQGVTALAAAAIVPLAPTTDLAFSMGDLIGNSLTVAQLVCRGRRLVNTSITSATPSLTVREFLAGFFIRWTAATAVDLFYDIQIRLHAADEEFWQPGK